MNLARSLMGCLFALVAQGCLSAGRERAPGPVLPAYEGEVATANRAPATGRLLGHVWVGVAGPFDAVMARFESEVAALGGNTAVIDGVMMYQQVTNIQITSGGIPTTGYSFRISNTIPTTSFSLILYGRAFTVRR